MKKVLHPTECGGQDDECDVHTEHCCSEHQSCKYGKEESDCTVVKSGGKIQTVCNCEWMF